MTSSRWVLRLQPMVARVLPAACVLLAATWFAGPAVASVVMPMDVATLADYAGQVLIGEVSAARSFRTTAPIGLETELTLTHVTYLKGATPDAAQASGGPNDTFTLIVPGGTVDGLTLRIADAPLPAVGERWLLFLLPAYHTHPVVGISQGAFRIATDSAGVARVRTVEGAAVLGVSAEGALLTPTSETSAVTPAAANEADDAGAARHVICGTVGVGGTPAAAAPSTAATPISLTDFTAQLTPILARSRDHHLTGPAGRPLHTSGPAVPLRAAPTTQPATADAARDAAQHAERTNAGAERRAARDGQEGRP